MLCAKYKVFASVIGDLLPLSLTENDSTITSLTSNWTDFYSSYQSFQSWLGNMDTEMSYINPFVGDLAAVREQLETQKVRTLRPNVCCIFHFYLVRLITTFHTIYM